MTELNIKKEIGRRILEARKAKDLTLKELGELAGGLKQTRLTNWEQGTRTPGPEEIKQLAGALGVSAAYLMCLTNEMQTPKKSSASVLVPLLDHQQASNPETYIQAIKDLDNAGNAFFISVSCELATNLGEYAFAMKMTNDSMTPEIRVNDVQIIEPSKPPAPGDYVAVKIIGKDEVIICQYKKLSYTSSEFELLTLNDNWPNITVDENVQVEIIGTVIQNIRTY